MRPVGPLPALAVLVEAEGMLEDVEMFGIHVV